MVWGALQAACVEPDPDKAESILKSYNLTLNNGLIQQTYDDRGYRYDLPPFVINPAVKYGESKPLAKVNSPVKAEFLELTFRIAGGPDLKIKVRSDNNVKSVKEKYLENANINKEIRLFFNGKELKDEFLLGHYSIPNNVVLQVFSRPN